MKKSLIITVLLLALSSSVYAATLSPPTVCPTDESIRASTSHVWINKSKPNTYFGFLDNQSYDTDRVWGLIIWDIQSSSMEDAERQAKHALLTAAYQYGPEQQSIKTWRCIYRSENGYYVVTYTDV